jgi:hypothetical protein
MRSVRRRRRNWRDEPITPARQRFNEAGCFGRIPQRVAQSIDRRIQAMFEIAEPLVAPQLSPQLFARDEVARPVEQKLKNAQGLSLKVQAAAGFTKLAGPAVEVEGSESNRTAEA